MTNSLRLEGVRVRYKQHYESEEHFSIPLESIFSVQSNRKAKSAANFLAPGTNFFLAIIQGDLTIFHFSTLQP